MRKIILIIIGVLAVGGGAIAGIYSWRYFRGSGLAFLPPIGNIAEELPTTTPSVVPGSENTTKLPLQLADGLRIRVLADDLPGARVLAWSPEGRLFVSRTAQGAVTELQFADGKVIKQEDVLKDLRKPHGLAFQPELGGLYVATEDSIIGPDYHVASEYISKDADLPLGGRHFTRTLLFGADERLYVSLGSSCDVCHEKNQMLATVQVLDLTKDEGLTQFAKGLRNAVFMALNPRTGEIWATEMGRDFLGDDLPPDEINILKAGSNYGWPICYSQNVHDTVFDQNTYIRNPCMEPFETPSTIDLPAHSAPLGLAFVPLTWPEPYRGDLLVAYHGSWNRTSPTGYKIVRFDLDDQGKVVSQQGQDFISGWLDEGRSLGRPVDLKFFDDKLYVSDDKAGLIYEVSLTE